MAFLVRMPDGRERLYGATNGSQQVITRADGTRVVSTWYLAQERDPRGNAIQYRYEHVTPTLPAAIAEAADPDPPVHDTVRISRIDYTGTASEDGAVAVNGTRSVRFSYAATPRLPDTGFSPDTGSLTEAPTPEDGFFHGSFGWRASVFPLERVRTYVDDTLVHELHLTGDDDGAARRYRLSSAQLCANAPAAPGSASERGLVCMPRTRFQWRDRGATGAIITDGRYGEPTFDTHTLSLDASLHRRHECGVTSWGAVFFCDDAWPTMALDANGDGADDLLYPRALRNGASRLALRFGGYSPRSDARLSPDGEADLPLARTTTRNIEIVPDRPERDVDDIASRMQWASSVDWDLDGRDDIVMLVHAIGEPLWELIALVASGGGRFVPVHGV